VWLVTKDFSFSHSLSAFYAPCSVCESRKEDLGGAMQPLHLFLVESKLPISRSPLWSSLKDHQEVSFDIAMWKVGPQHSPAHWELCLMALIPSLLTSNREIAWVFYCISCAFEKGTFYEESVYNLMVPVISW